MLNSFQYCFSHCVSHVSQVLPDLNGQSMWARMSGGVEYSKKEHGVPDNVSHVAIDAMMITDWTDADGMALQQIEKIKPIVAGSVSNDQQGAREALI